MGIFLARRSIALLATVFAVAVFCFVLLHLLPGGPFDLDSNMSPEVVQSLQAQYGADLPLLQQLERFVGNLVQFEMGNSLVRPSLSFADWFMAGLPFTLKLGFWSLLTTLGFGLALAVISQLAGGVLRGLSLGATSVLVSSPLLFVGPLVIYYFSYHYQIFPLFLDGSGWSYVLPIITLSARPTGKLAQIVADSLEKTMNMDFIRTARATGASPLRLVVRQAMPHALLSALANMGILVAQLLSGSLIVEVLFSSPGLGRGYVEAILSRDYNFVVGATVYFAVLLGLANLLMDILMKWIDPRMETL